MPSRFKLYLYSSNNIAGCILAMAGLALLFTGMISSFWWLIVAGLYGAGALGWPRSSLAQIAESAELSPDLLAEQLHRLIESVAKGLPKEALDQLRSIESTLKELLPRLQELKDRNVISAKDAFTVIETIRRYLPDTLAAYLRLPRLYAQNQTLADGRTAAQTLRDQLKVLDASLKEVAKNAYSGDAEALITNGRFLEAKFLS